MQFDRVFKCCCIAIFMVVAWWHHSVTAIKHMGKAVLIAGEDDEMFMTRSLNVMPKTTEQHI